MLRIVVIFHFVWNSQSFSEFLFNRTQSHFVRDKAVRILVTSRSMRGSPPDATVCLLILCSFPSRLYIRTKSQLTIYLSSFHLPTSLPQDVRRSKHVFLYHPAMGKTCLVILPINASLIWRVNLRKVSPQLEALHSDGTHGQCYARA
jgi:hypothetical protein